MKFSEDFPEDGNGGGVCAGDGRAGGAGGTGTGAGVADDKPTPAVGGAPSVRPPASPTTNACKLCSPLGACLAFRGVRGAMPFLHGSQGCATYIRRYVISHFREPLDIAASNFSETSAVFGGGLNVRLGLENVIRQYKPELVGLATTCLSETIGENLAGHLHDFHDEHADGTVAGVAIPPVVSVSCASYKGTHAEGFHKAVRGLVEQLVGSDGLSPRSPLPPPRSLALFPNFVSPEDLRELRTVAATFALPVTLVPDYSDTLDGPAWADYEKLPAGGTSVDEIRALAGAPAAIEFGRSLAFWPRTAATILAERCGVPAHRIGLPIGIRETDKFMQVLAGTSSPLPAPCSPLPSLLPPAIAAQRGRFLDSLADAHKYVFEKRAVVFGEEDLVAGLAALLAEIGVVPVVCATGGHSGHFREAVLAAAPELAPRADAGEIVIRDNCDFDEIAADARALRPDFLLGSSKGYKLARELGVPLIRCGFPIHDRIGAQRVRHLCYTGAQSLFDRITNALLERKQDASPIGYSYL
ncbi:MAG: nitrogenase [Puniceicoccales bacterium]|jgi:nitrogenase molybdenum-iron protein NifN|nr:nitrogenase [Puniceicoccales bacterium]